MTNRLPANMILRTLSGSHAYGMNTATSDVDYRGIFCGDEKSIRTPFFTQRQFTDSNEEDTMYHELSHFLKLTVDANPNILELLWVADKHIELRTDAYDFIRSHRSDLLSSKCAFTFSGYAFAQLKRIKGHNGWFNKPEQEQGPRQCEFLTMVQNFTPDKVFKLNFSEVDKWNGYVLFPYGTDVYGVYPQAGEKLFNADGTLKVGDPNAESLMHNFDRKSPHFIVKFNRTEYNSARERWKGYWNWKKTRNEKRSALEELHGYDTKHASHLVRLLRMGVEILETGVVHVERPDAAELLQIRAGSMKYEELLEYAAHMDEEIKRLYKITQLNKRVDLEKAAKILMTAQDMAWGR